jgi:hypothetical protein
MDIKTYDIKCGTVGILPDGNKKMVFPTEDEAVEYIREEQLNNDEDSEN